MLNAQTVSGPPGGLALHDDLFEHSHITDADREEIAQSIWRQETVEMNTVGINMVSPPLICSSQKSACSAKRKPFPAVSWSPAGR